MINTTTPTDYLEEEALSKIGKWLTLEQIKTLEDTFADFPENFDRSSIYANMWGIYQQLIALNDKPGCIFYIRGVHISDGELGCSIEKMLPGVNVSISNHTSESTEPTESQIREYMKSTGKDYYNAREELREEAYGNTYSKSPGQSWGDFWKSY